MRNSFLNTCGCKNTNGTSELKEKLWNKNIVQVLMSYSSMASLLFKKKERKKERLFPHRENVF